MKVGKPLRRCKLRPFFAELKWVTILHMIRFRFDTFSFDKIRKGVKVNLIDKFSHIGGTVGLLNGFSIIFLFELFAFGITSIFKFFKNKERGSNAVEVEETPLNDNENVNVDIQNKLYDMSKKFEKLEQDRYKMIESNQKLMSIQRDLWHRMNEDNKKFIALEKELNIQRHIMDEDGQKLEALESELKKKC